MTTLRCSRISERTGQTFDILVDREEQILDGRARLRACQELGITPKWDYLLRDDPASFVMSTMTALTSYSKAQQAFTAARLLEELNAERARKNFTGRVTSAAGELVGGVSAPYVTEAASVLANADLSEVVDLVDNRKLERFTHVRAIVKLPDEERAKAIAKIRAGKEPAVVLKDAAVNKGDEWYTPLDVATAVKWAFGGDLIPCDPCHPTNDDSPVEAKLKWTELDNGWTSRGRTEPSSTLRIRIQGRGLNAPSRKPKPETVSTCFSLFAHHRFISSR